MKISKNWKKKALIYKYFSREFSLDFSQEAALAMYEFESTGKKLEGNVHANGFYVGKQRTNLHQTMWSEDIKEGLLQKYELIFTPNYFPMEIIEWIWGWIKELENGRLDNEET